MTPDEARAFIRSNHRAVMVTRRRDGSVQTSPVLAGVDDGGNVVVSSRGVTAKTHNVRRDPRMTLCLLSDNFFGRWIQVDGRAEVIPLPDAMDGLIAYYRGISGEHPDWDEYRRAMEEERRVLIRMTIEHAGPSGS